MILSKLELAILGAVLAVAELVQRTAISAVPAVHTAIGILLIVLAALGATTAAASYLGQLIPHQVALLLATVAGVLQTVQTQIGMSNLAHGLVGAALVLAATVGIKPNLPVTAK